MCFKNGEQVVFSCSSLYKLFEKRRIDCLEVGLDAVACNDDADEQDDEQGDNDIGNHLERLARHGAMLVQMGVHVVVVARHGAQLVLIVG